MKGQTRLLLTLVPAAVVFATVPVALAGVRHAATTTVVVTEGKPSSLKFTLSPKTFKHGKVTFKVTNKDTSGIAHDFKWCTKPVTNASANSCVGKGTATIGQGASATLTVTILKAGTYEYLCTVPGHAAAGMKGVVRVT